MGSIPPSPTLTYHPQWPPSATFLPSSPLPSPSARPSTTLSPLPSSAPFSVMPTAAHSRPTPRRSTSTPRRLPPPLPRGVAPSSALPSSRTVLVLSSTLPAPSPTRALLTSAL